MAADQQGFTAGSSQALDAGQATFPGMLRATRDGGGSGRTYTVTFAVADSAGNVGQCQGTVVVPHDQGR